MPPASKREDYRQLDALLLLLLASYDSSHIASLLSVVVADVGDACVVVQENE